MFDDNNPDGLPVPSETASAGSSAPEAAGAPAITPNPPASAPIPEDLRISWSWPHLIVFLFFAFGSYVFVQIALVAYLTSQRHVSAKQLQNPSPTLAPYLVATQLLIWGLVLLFLYVTLGVLQEAPFWRAIGWRAFANGRAALKAAVWRYFLIGCGLALFVAVTGAAFHPKEKLPVEEMFSSRTAALLLMSLAVLVAPLVEETVFRGYLYPLFARKLGVPAGIFITGVLFGMLHGMQLGWTWGLVALLTFVGLVLTYVRARTGTVLASYLLHLGYNSMLALSMVLASAAKHLQKLPLGR